MESSEKPVVLVLASTYPRWVGDPEPAFVHELSRRLVTQFHVIVLCPHAQGASFREIRDGVEIVRYRYAPSRFETLVNNGGIVTNLSKNKWKLLLVPGFLLVQTLQAWRLMRSRRVDVIHAHWLIPQGLIAALLNHVSARKVPYLVTSHGADLYALKGRWMSALKEVVIRHSRAVTVVSGAMHEALKKTGTDMSKVSVLPMGVDFERFSSRSHGDRSVSEILFVGRLVEKKGVCNLIDALPAVIRKKPDAHLTIAGFGPDEKTLRQQVHALGIVEQVSFLGAVSQDQLPSLYRRAAVFVAPFRKAVSGDQEGLPVALMEAIACGCPVIAGYVPGIEDVLGSMTAECMVDCSNPALLSEAIVNILSEPVPALGRSERLRAAVAAKVDWGCISSGYGQLLKALVDGKIKP